MIWFLAHPDPSHVSKRDLRHTGRLRKRDMLTGEGAGVGGGAESYDRNKAWTSINHSIFSDVYFQSEKGFNPLVARVFSYLRIYM